jgi:hypothetical protein
MGAGRCAARAGCAGLCTPDQHPPGNSALACSEPWKLPLTTWKNLLVGFSVRIIYLGEVEGLALISSTCALKTNSCKAGGNPLNIMRKKSKQCYLSWSHSPGDGKWTETNLVLMFKQVKHPAAVILKTIRRSKMVAIKT